MEQDKQQVYQLLNKLNYKLTVGKTEWKRGNSESQDGRGSLVLSVGALILCACEFKQSAQVFTMDEKNYLISEAKAKTSHLKT